MIDASDMFSAAFKVCLPDVVAQVSQICLGACRRWGLCCGQKGGLMRSPCSSPNPFAGPSINHQQEYWKEQYFCSGM